MSVIFGNENVKGHIILDEKNNADGQFPYGAFLTTTEWSSWGNEGSYIRPEQVEGFVTSLMAAINRFSTTTEFGDEKRAGRITNSSVTRSSDSSGDRIVAIVELSVLSDWDNSSKVAVTVTQAKAILKIFGVQTKS